MSPLRHPIIACLPTVAINAVLVNFSDQVSTL